MEAKLKREKLTAPSIEKQKDMVKNVILANIVSKDEEEAKKAKEAELKKEEMSKIEAAETQKEVETNGEKVVPNVETKEVENNEQELNNKDDGQQYFIFDSALMNVPKYDQQIDFSERLPRDYKSNESSFYSQLEKYVNKRKNTEDKTFTSHKLPKILSFAGIESSNLSVQSDVLKKAKNIGDFTNKEIISSLENIANPVALQLDDTKKDNEIIAYTNTFKKGKPIVLTFSYQNDKASLNLKEISTLNDNHLMNDNAKLLYINDNRTNDWISITKEKFPQLELNTDIPDVKKFTEYSELYSHPLTLINAGIDDKHLTKAQKVDIENTRNEIVDPILNGKENGLWAAFKDFKEYGVFDITGKQIDLDNGQITHNGMQQLNAAMEIYRNKKFESFRYLFVDKHDGEIIDQLSVSAHLPSSCPVSVMKGSVAENLEEVIERAKEKDCQIVVAHNHPSGNPEPSPEDIEVTKELETIFNNRVGDNTFLGHIILDHDKFSYYSPEESWRMYRTDDVKQDRFVKDNLPTWFRTQLRDRQALINVAGQVNDMNNWNDNFVPVLFANAELRVTAMKLYKTDFFMNHNFESMHNKLQMDAFNLAGTSVFPVVTDATWNKLSPSAQLGLEIQLKNGIKKNCFTDAAIPGNSIINKHHIDCGKFYTEPKRIDNIEVKSTWNKRIDAKLFEQANKTHVRKDIEMER